MTGQLDLAIPGTVECELEYIVDGVFYGSVSRPYSWQNEDGGWKVRQSAAYLCPRCLKLWAILRCSKEPTFVVERQVCRQCPPLNGEAPGVLSLSPFRRPIDPLLLLYLPEPLLRREFELHLKHYEGVQA